MQPPRNRRGMFALLIVLAALAVSITYSPLVQVTKQAEASTAIYPSWTYPSAGYGNHECTFGGTAAAVGNHVLRYWGWYGTCNPALRKGVTARIYRNQYRMPNGIWIERALVAQEAVGAHTGDTAASTNPHTVDCVTFTTYSLEVTVYVGYGTRTTSDTGLQCL